MRIDKIVEITGGALEGDGAIEIFRVASLEAAGAGEISFVEKADSEIRSNASCLIVPENFASAASQTVIKVKNPKLAFAKIGKILHAHKRRAGFHETAFIAPNADVRAAFVGAFVSIGENSFVGDGAEISGGVKIGNNVRIGARAIIYPNCVIYDDVLIGSDCIIHAGAVLGADGFGFVRDGADGFVKFPQIGTIEIGDEVEIGANTCIDRGALGATKIGSGTKIDNLVQIGHNVQIGARVVIAAQTGISGSTVIEDDCVIGGQVGMGDHARVLSGAIIGSQAGVLPGKIVRAGIWWGTPVQPLDEYKRQNAMVKGLARLREEVKELKKKLSGA